MYTLHPDKIYAVNKLLGKRRAAQRTAMTPAAPRFQSDAPAQPAPAPAPVGGFERDVRPVSPVAQRAQQGLQSQGSPAGSLIQRLAERMYHDSLEYPGG